MPTNTTELTATRKNIAEKVDQVKPIDEGTFSHSIKSARGKYIYNKEECKFT